MDNKLSWTNSIKEIVGKMGNGISIIKRCAKCLTQKSIRQAVGIKSV